MSVTYQGTIPARRTIFKRQSRWPGVARRLFVVCLARGGIARRVIVDHDNRARIQFERPLDDFTRIDRCLVDRTRALLLGRDQCVLSVEKQDMKAFAWCVAECRAAVGDDLVAGIENLA